MQTIGKLIFDLIQLYIVVKILYKVSTFLLLGKFGNKKKSYSRNGILHKVFKLFTNRIGYYLDDSLKAQKTKRLATLREQQAFQDTSNTDANVISIDKYKRTKAK